MMALELALRDPWRPCGAIARGGTVLGIALGPPEQVWLATDAGVWQRDAGRWRSLGLPLHATALVWANGLLIAGSASGGILYSGDNGRSWYSAWVDETTSAVTCFAASPSLSSGQVLLAGTD